MTRRVHATAALLVTAIVGAVLGIWLTGGSHLIGVYLSPDKQEQVEIYSPARWQRRWFDPGITPAVARFTDLQADRIVAESGVFEFGGGSAQVIWRADYVQIGTVAVYHRASHRWELDA